MCTPGATNKDEVGGFATTLFSGEVDPDLRCPICQEVLYQPVMVRPCEHVFCKGCLVQWHRSEQSGHDILWYNEVYSSPQMKSSSSAPSLDVLETMRQGLTPQATPAPVSAALHSYGSVSSPLPPPPVPGAEHTQASTCGVGIGAGTNNPLLSFALEEEEEDNEAGSVARRRSVDRGRHSSFTHQQPLWEQPPHSVQAQVCAAAAPCHPASSAADTLTTAPQSALLRSRTSSGDSNTSLPNAFMATSASSWVYQVAPGALSHSPPLGSTPMQIVDSGGSASNSIASTFTGVGGGLSASPSIPGRNNGLREAAQSAAAHGPSMEVRLQCEVLAQMNQLASQKMNRDEKARRCILQAQKLSCPICRSKMTNIPLPAPRIIRNVLQHLPMHCPFKERGCTETHPMEDIQSHVKLCPKAPVLCPYEGCKMNLQENALNQEDFKMHEQTCEFSPNAQIACPQGCGMTVRRADLWLHTESACNNVPICCPIAGCAEVIKRGALEAHLKENLAKHFQWLGGNLNSKVDLQNVLYMSKEVNELRAKLEHVSGRNLQLEQQVAQLSSEMTKCQMVMMSMLRGFDAKFSESKKQSGKLSWKSIIPGRADCK